MMAWEELLETRKEPAQIAACKFKLLSSITSMSALRKCQSNILGAKERFKEVAMRTCDVLKRKSRDEQPVEKPQDGFNTDVDSLTNAVLLDIEDDYVKIDRVQPNDPLYTVPIPETETQATCIKQPLPDFCGSGPSGTVLEAVPDLTVPWPGSVNVVIPESANLKQQALSDVDLAQNNDVTNGNTTTAVPTQETPSVVPCAIKLSNFVLFGAEEQGIEAHATAFGSIEKGLHVVGKDKTWHNIISDDILACLPEPQASPVATLPHPPEYLERLLKNKIAHGVQDMNDFPTIVHIQEYQQSLQYPVLHLFAAQLFVPGKSMYIIPYDLGNQLNAPLFAKLCHLCEKKFPIVQDYLLDQVATACCNTSIHSATKPTISTDSGDIEAVTIDFPETSPHLALLFRGQDKLQKLCYDDQELVSKVEEYAKEEIKKRIDELHEYCVEQQRIPQITDLSSENCREVLVDTCHGTEMQWNWFFLFAYLKACGMKYSPISISESEFHQLASEFHLSMHESSVALNMFQQLHLLCHINGRYYIIGAQDIAQLLVSLAAKTSGGKLNRGQLTRLERDLFHYLLKRKVISEEQAFAPFLIDFHLNNEKDLFDHACSKKIPPIYILPNSGTTPPGFFESFVLCFADGSLFRQVYASHFSTTFELKVDENTNTKRYLIRVSKTKQFMKIEFSRETNEAISMETAESVSGIIWKQIKSTMSQLQRKNRMSHFLECADRRCEQKGNRVHLAQIDLLREEAICCKEKVRDRIDARHKIWINTLKRDVGSKTCTVNSKFRDFTASLTKIKNTFSSSPPHDTNNDHLGPVAIDYEVIEVADHEVKITQGNFKSLFDEFVKKSNKALDNWLDLKEIRHHFFRYRLIDSETAQSLMDSSHRSQSINTILRSVESAGPCGVVALVSVVKQTILNDSIQDDHQLLYHQLSTDTNYKDILKLWLHSVVIS